MVSRSLLGIHFGPIVQRIVRLTLKAPVMTAADDIHKYFFYCFSEKIRLDVSSESSAGRGFT